MAKISRLLNVYDTETDEYLMTSASRQAIAKELNITTDRISDYLCKGYKIDSRYILERVETAEATDKAPRDKNSLPQHILDDWDRTRLLINPGARS